MQAQDRPDDDDERGGKPGRAAPHDLTSNIGLIDVHCHLLPGVDDGCRETAESVECARRLAGAGFTHAFCTPHVEANLPHNNVADTPAAVAQLQAALDEAGVRLTLFPGGEVRLTERLMRTAPEDLLLMNLGRSRGGRFLMFDSWEAAWPAYLDKTMTWLADRGVTPIMAHPERCAFVCEDPLNAAERLAELGVLLQLDCYVLGDESAAAKGMFSKPMREAAERLIEFDYYSFLATDTHRPETLDDRLAALDAARHVIGISMFRRLTKRNPMQLLPE